MKYFEDIVQDSPRTGLGIPVETKHSLSRTNTPPAEPPFGFSALNDADSQVRSGRRTADAGPDVISTGPSIVSLSKPTSLSSSLEV